MKSKYPTQIIVLFFFLILISFSVNAYQITLESPESIISGDNYEAKIIIDHSSKFNGSLKLEFQNIDTDAKNLTLLEENFSGTRFTYVFSFIGIAVGDFRIHAELYDENDTLIDTQSFKGTVNTSEPQILTVDSPPTEIEQRNSVIIIYTNEDSTCKYANSNKSYSAMSNTFETTGTKEHIQELDSLSEGQHTYYIRCKDKEGHSMKTSKKIEFKVNLPPSGDIVLSKDSPLTEGIVEVKVYTSENLIETPDLSYSFDTSPHNNKPISLTGSGSIYTGHLIITKDDNNKIGTFFLSCKDEDGTEGNDIDKGKTFIVDTEAPPVPKSIDAISQYNGHIELKWYYDSEDIDEVRIYRSTSKNLDYINYFDSVDGNRDDYIDENVENKVTYYYRINVIDKAGNRGDLSKEVFATSINENLLEKDSGKKESNTPKVLPPDLVKKVQDKIENIESIKIDIDQIKQDFDKNNELDNIKGRIDLENKILDSSKKIQDILDNLNNLKLNYKSESELQHEFDITDNEIETLIKTTPQKVNIISTKDYIKNLNLQDYELAIQKLFLNSGIPEKDIKSYKKELGDMQEKIVVSSKATKFSITYMNNDQEVKTLIVENIAYKNSEKINDVIVYEKIPDSIVEDLDTIDFITKKSESLNEENMIKFIFKEMDFNGQDISFIINKDVNLEKLDAISTSVLIGPVQLDNSISKISGAATQNVFESFVNTSGKNLWFIILGISIISILLVYQVFISKGYTYSFIDRIRDQKDNLKFEINTRKNMLNNFIKKEDNDYWLVSQLIEWSIQHINKGEIDQAAILYEKVSNLYKTLTPYNKEKVYPQCMELKSNLEMMNSK